MNLDSIISRILPIGIQNFEKLHTEGYFSNLNQLQDISLHPAYTTLCERTDVRGNDGKVYPPI